MAAIDRSTIYHQKWYDFLEQEHSTTSSVAELVQILMPHSSGGPSREHPKLSSFNLFIDHSPRALPAKKTEAKISKSECKGHNFNGNIIFSDYLGTQCPFIKLKIEEHLILSKRDLFFKAVHHNSVIGVFNLTSIEDAIKYQSDSYLTNADEKPVTTVCQSLQIVCTKCFKEKRHYRRSHHELIPIKEESSHKFVYVKVVDWPDGDVVPVKRLHALVKKAKKIRAKMGPGIIAVHCLAGLGRTGTFIVACEIERLFHEQILTVVNYKRVIAALILTARDQRNPDMVSSQDQIYLLYHYATQLLSGSFSKTKK